jgi:2-aminoadipate transaminase
MLKAAIGMLLEPQLNPQAETPIYRQIFSQIRAMIEAGALRDGEKLPATRELAGRLGLNRTTVSAAYDLLEKEGFLQGHVGRGSFVRARRPDGAGLPWEEMLQPGGAPAAPEVRDGDVSFSNSRPSELLFPLDEFRATCREVIDSEEAQSILQLGSSAGYAPLRGYLLERAREEGPARASDDILITSGVQQAFDLIQRVLVAGGETVLLEDPVYSGLRNVFSRAGARVIGVPVGPGGIDLNSLERALQRERPRLLVLTPSYQNPTGATLSLEAREAIVAMTMRSGAILVENDIYGALSYEGAPPPTLKELEANGDVVLLRSFSKLAFPGLRVGWMVGPRALISRLVEAKQYSDIHTDQLAQAVLLRFALSGRLQAHRDRIRASGRERLRAALGACEEFLPEGTRFTRPGGGMNLWVRLPEPLDASELLPRARRAGVSYLPGRHFAVSRVDNSSLRISFAHLPPDKIRGGLAALGRVFQSELDRLRDSPGIEAAPALV